FTEMKEFRVLGTTNSKGVPANFMSEGFAHYVNAGWEARTSLYAFYCARFNILETWNFISPASLIVLLQGVIEAEHKTLVKTACKEAEAAVSTLVGNY
ncbi:unnamed protein product, partial [Effrenium voratum]